MFSFSNFKGKTSAPQFTLDSSDPTTFTIRWQHPPTSATITGWRIQYREAGLKKKQIDLESHYTEQLITGKKQCFRDTYTVYSPSCFIKCKNINIVKKQRMVATNAEVMDVNPGREETSFPHTFDENLYFLKFFSATFDICYVPHTHPPPPPPPPPPPHTHTLLVIPNMTKHAKGSSLNIDNFGSKNVCCNALEGQGFLFSSVSVTSSLSDRSH